MSHREPEAPGLKRIDVMRYAGGTPTPSPDVVAREEPLELRLNGRTLVYLMRMPGDEAALAAGFCLSEGHIGAASDIKEILYDGGGLVEVAADTAGNAAAPQPRLVMTGAGGAGFGEGFDTGAVSVSDGPAFPRSAIVRMPAAMRERQPVFAASGGTHAAGLFDASGAPHAVMEDIGRHNAVDKALGQLILTGGTTEDKCMVLSGRLSCEMVVKAARAGVPALFSISAPTALGIEVAEKAGVTLVGFLRGETFNTYTHPERIGGE